MNKIVTELYSEILPGLYMGGTADDDVVDVAKPLKNFNDSNEFDSVVTAYSWAQPMSWHCHENRYGFADGFLDENTLSKVKDISEWIYSEWQRGRRCLVRCQAGLNRSGLIIAMCLVKAGYSPQQAIDLIRQKRSPQALFNQHFVQVLMKIVS